ncbi:hypothetical protein [Opacimonas viscosa]|uniref:Uncharacterized protein n=1 Tax=Opacimonas viscosa TaxID=2961944 RepID=A0AA42BM44_9ALTE|nr:hypothetical protein [Opacimonas viscosa]MCP3429578.1 hypothetical protein [Opacimonas viscosa]
MYGNVIWGEGQNVPISLEMHSEGGKPTEAIILGEFIKQYDITVEILGNCISACSMVLLSSNNRYVHPKAWVGFHASYNKDKNQNVHYESNSLKFHDSNLEKLLKNVGANEAFILQALVKDAWGGFFPSFEELKQAGIANRNTRLHKQTLTIPSYLAD